MNPTEQLWVSYSRRLHAFIRRRVPADAADDILQEVFVRVHRDLCCRSEWAKPEGWIYRITRNLIIDHYRRRRPVAEIPESLAAPEPPAEDAAAPLALSLREMVHALPEPYREALLLTEYEGLSQPELARRAGISVSGAKTRVQRARVRLRDMLLACCHFELDRRGHVIDYYARCCCCRPHEHT
jgi:RNA polymerase sigma-70 factor (ECF subfamily)